MPGLSARAIDVMSVIERFRKQLEALLSIRKLCNPSKRGSMEITGTVGPQASVST
jgi:hypothetical protein